MENPVGIKKIYANIIMRCINRVIVRNKEWDLIQSQGYSKCTNIRNVPVVNTDTLLGNTTETTPELYQYYIYQDNMWYFYDIRELIHQFKLNYECSNPYTNKKLSKYVKYRAIRHYYKSIQNKQFIELVWETPSYTGYQLCISTLNAQMSQFGITCDIEQLNENVLYILISHLITWDKRYITASALQFLPLLNLNYINGNTRSYRAICYLFLTHIIECQNTHDDKYEMALKIVARANYCHISDDVDPLVQSLTHSQFLRILGELVSPNIVIED